jgi:hypothetical protein
MKVFFFKPLLILSLVFLSACGGGGGGGGSTSTPSVSSTLTGTLSINIGSNTYSIINATYSTSSSLNGTTNTSGQYTYKSGDTVTFTIAGRTYNVTAAQTITPETLLAGDSTAIENLKTLLAHIDNDSDNSNGINLGNESSATHQLDLSASEDSFTAALYKATGVFPKSPFTPSLGINIEAPQAEADTAGQAIAFVDVFRTARPFTELSSTGVNYDQNGWPTDKPANSTIRTKVFQGTLQQAIPAGIYTVLFDGQGTLQFGGSSLTQQTQVNSNQYELTITPQDSSSNAEANSLNVVIASTATADPLRNIRIIMPGGLCRDENKTVTDPLDPHNSNDNIFLRVESADSCPSGTQYITFVQMLQNDRNMLIFNPDYLRHLRDYYVIRMMNFMEASPGFPCESFSSINQTTYDNCVLTAISWDNRATLDDAVWGGSSRTAQVLHKGVPVEVLATLSNQLNISPWFTLPHFADDQYVENFATYMANNLNDGLKVYLEYSNETWNSGFSAYHFVQLKGQQAGLNTVPSQYQNDTTRDANYFARLRYYTQRALEIFQLWDNTYTNLGKSTDKLVKILGSQQGDTVLTKEMLEHNTASTKVHAVAIAPYFFGCIDRNSVSCSTANKVLSEVQTVDDIFDILQAPFTAPSTGDPSALAATLYKTERQATEVNNYNLKLMTYEGGQHLTIMGSMGNLDQTEKDRLRGLFKQANRDTRMKALYQQQLDHWKNLYNTHNNNTLFTLYTAPQSFYDFGNWGIKEHLNQARSDAPKYDAVMTFQENVGKCWWDQCE